MAVVDEDGGVRESLRAMLHEHGEVRTFSSLDGFVCEAQLDKFDCILAEATTARELHLHLIQAGINTPVIYLAAQPTVAGAVAAIKLGAVDYLEQPVVPAALLRALSAAHRQRRSGVPERFFGAEVALDPMLDAMERELICGALQRSDGVVGGRKGAAALLGVTRTGLLYKMKRLGISRALVNASEPEEDSLDAGAGTSSFSDGASSSTTT
jgi:DNA-binding NtrC family response regulator